MGASGMGASSAACADETLARRAAVSSWMKIWIVAASGTAVSAPRTPSSAPNSVTATMMKNPERLTAFPWIFGVAINAVQQVAFLSNYPQAYPLWNILIIALNVLVLFALTARWQGYKEAMAV